MDTFNFILDNESVVIDTLQEPPDYVGPNLNQLVKTTRKKFGEDILATYEKIGGANWLYTQAMADPKAFFELLKKMIPNPTIGDAIADLTIKLIDKYCDPARKGIPATSEQGTSGSGQPDETATGGTPNLIEMYKVPQDE